MKIKNIQFGEVEFDENMVIEFKDGLIGFENYKKFILINAGDEEYFLWLTSIDEPEVVFPLLGARMIEEEYPQKDNHEAFGIVKLNQDPAKMTINLKAPVYIDQNNKKGYQIILEEEKYPINYNLFIEN